MDSPGKKLRDLRRHLGMSLRAVETASAQIAARYKNKRFIIPFSYLAYVESRNLVPRLHRLYSLALIYQYELGAILSWYGFEVSGGRLTEGGDSSGLALQSKQGTARPFRRSQTQYLGSLDAPEDMLPFRYLALFGSSSYTYGYVGEQDFTMYPLVLPGSLLQLDESRNKIVRDGWRSEYERPIYFVETREGYVCCWCSIEADRLLLQSHPLSPVPVRVMQHRQDAEVLGQVVGLVMNVDRRGSNAS